MLNQLRVIALCYATKIANWLFVAMGLGCLLFGWWMGRETFYTRATPSQPSFWQSATPTQIEITGENAEGTKQGRMLDEWRWSEEDESADCWRVHGGSGLPWSRLAKLPNLRQLDLEHYEPESSISDTEFRGISELTNLEYLTLPKQPISREVTQAWKDLEKLEWLVVGSCEIDIESLPVFPKLHTLDMRLSQLSDECVNYLVKLPNLKTLILQGGSHNLYHSPTTRRGGSDLESPQANDPAVAKRVTALANIATLKTVYLPGQECGSLESIARSSLLDVSVRPLAVNTRIFASMACIALGGMLLCAVPAMGVYGQFTRPESILTPGYATHQLFALIFIAGSCMLTVFVAAYSGVHWLPAAACIALMLGYFSLILRINPPVWLIRSAPAIYLLLFFHMFFRVQLRNFFLGHAHVLLPLAMLAFGVSLVAYWIYLVRGFHRSLVEQGVSFPLLTKQDGAVAAQIMGANRAKETGGPLLLRFFKPNEKRLDSIGSQSFHGQEPRKRRSVLKLAGNADLAFRITVGLLVLYGGILGANYFLRTRIADFDVMHLLGCWYALTMSMISAIAWTSRRQTFGSELCRPITRRDYIRDLFSIRFRESTLLPLGMICIATVYALATKATVASALAWSIGMAVCIVGIAVTYYGTGMLVLSVARSWVVILSGVLALVAVVAGIGAVIFLSSSDGRPPKNLTPFAMVMGGVLLNAIGLSTLVFARSRWSVLEFASLLRDKS